MSTRALMLLGALLVACGDDASGDSTATDNSTTDGAETGKMAGMTAAHNTIRKNVQPPASTPIPDITWSADIAKIAQTYSDKCVFEHSGNSTYGENLFASYGTTETPSSVVNDWASEAANYDYPKNSCAAGKVCGHYTQVVWANSTQVGCGATMCTRNSPFGNSNPWSLWVCNYAPPGNYVGQKPY